MKTWLTFRNIQAEMKHAKEQTYDLTLASDFMTSLMSPDRREKEKAKPPSLRQVNGRPKLVRLDSLSRFSEPPAPPPKQPLPEKPDAPPRLGNSDTAITNNLKRSDTEKPKLPGSSPVSRESSQILSLVEALASARKELEAQGARVKELEDLLIQERAARESAEERARGLDVLKSTPDGISEVETAFEPPSEPMSDASEDVTIIEPTEERPIQPTDSPPVDATLQQRLNDMMAEMDAMRTEVEKYKNSAEQAQNDAAESRKTLAEMIESIRHDRAQAAEAETKGILDVPFSKDDNASGIKMKKEESPFNCVSPPVRGSNMAHIEHVTPLAKQRYRNYLVEQSAPYASMLGVVLLGVGIMAYLNGWQKVEK